MASKVNVKFVVLLSAFLVLTGVGVGVAYYVVKRHSGEHYAAMGDKAMKDGNIDLADNWYERAVGKEQFNLEWLRKWQKAREQKVPASNAYLANYQMYQGILRNIAHAQKSNVEAYCDLLQSIYLECEFSNAKPAWEYLATRVDEDLRYFEPEAPPAMRRYRGMAITATLDESTPRDRYELAQKDLVAALAANPKDAPAAMSLASWHEYAARRARVASDDAARQSHEEKSRKAVTDLLAADPRNVQGMLALLTLDAVAADSFADPSKSASEVVRIRQARMEALAPRVQEIADVIAGTPDVNPLVVQRFAVYAPSIDRKNGTEIALKAVDARLVQDPEDLDLLMTRAMLVSSQNKAPEIMAAYQKIIDLKDKPVSFEGLRLLTTRNRARFAQANAALQAVVQAAPEARSKAMEEARRYRTELAKQIAEQSPEMQFIDAKMAMLENDTPRARRLLAEFLKAPGDVGEASVMEANLFMADVGLRSNEPGLAREHLKKVLAARPASIELKMMLAAVERTMQNYEAAGTLYVEVLNLAPDHEQAKKELEIVRAVREGGKIEDPVLKAIVDAERLSIGSQDKLGDVDAALALLQRAMEENNHDPRLVTLVARILFERGERDKAQQTVEAGLAKNPDSTKPGVTELAQFGRRLQAAKTLEGVIGLIEEAKLSEVDKQLALYRAYLDFDKPEEAKKALEAAERAAPNSPRVVDLRFQEALKSNDMARATQLADQAARQNLDQADGDTFRARVQIAQKDYREAVATLGRAVERGNASAMVYRLLGLVQAELGRTQDAIASFRRAITMVPTDISTIKLYLNMLVSANELSEAVGVARKSEMTGRWDPEFLNLWLSLEARAGRTDFAIAHRKTLRARSPKDRENAAALADLYMDQKSWDPAREIIDALKAEKPTLRGAVLEARWHSDRGSMDQAKTVLREYIGTLTERQDKQDAYIAFGQFLQARGFMQEAMASFRQARDNQDPQFMAVDLMLGDFQMTQGMFEEAEKSYRRVLEAKVPDSDLKIRKRLIEALNQAQKYAEADEECKKLGDAAVENDVELLALRASAARGVGDTKRAMDLLNMAVTKFPNEPMPYLRRARLLAQDPALVKDAMTDLATAIKIRPSFWQALRTRAMMHLAAGQTEECLRDLREGVERNPALDDLRLELVDYLIRFGREAEAVDVADVALKARPNDTRLMNLFSSSFIRAGRWSRAARYLKLRWEQIQDEHTALTYFHALMNSTPPGLAEADAVLATPILQVDRSWRLLMARAILRKKQGRDPAAREDLLASFELIGGDRAVLLAWAEALRDVYPEPSARAAVMGAVRAPAALEDWMGLVRAGVAIEDPATLSQGIELLKQVRERAKDNELRGQIQVLLHQALIKQEKWEEALKEISLGLQYLPRDAVLANNAAAILSEKVNRPREAVPFAERANVQDPRNWAFADTLAAAYWATGDKEGAIRKMTEALRLAGTEVDKARTALKLGRYKLETGDIAGARMVLDLVRELVADNPAVGDAIKSDYEKFQADMSGK